MSNPGENLENISQGRNFDLKAENLKSLLCKITNPNIQKAVKSYVLIVKLFLNIKIVVNTFHVEESPMTDCKSGWPPK